MVFWDSAPYTFSGFLDLFHELCLVDGQQYTILNYDVTVYYDMFYVASGGSVG